MCKICEGQEPLPELYEGYTPGPLWFGVEGLTELERRWHTNCNCEIQEMTNLGANVFAHGSEEGTYYKFKFCPECGRKLIEDTNESRS